MEEQIAVDVCANPKCEWPIYQGDEVWKKGKDLFCHIKCLTEALVDETEKNKTCATNTRP